MWFSLGLNVCDKHSQQTIISVFVVGFNILGDLCISFFIKQIISKIPFKQMDCVGFFNMSGSEFHKFAPEILKLNLLISNLP